MIDPCGALLAKHNCWEMQEFWGFSPIILLMVKKKKKIHVNIKKKERSLFMLNVISDYGLMRFFF